MEDIITFLRFLQKLEQGGLIRTEQIWKLEDILKSTLRKNLSNGVYDSLEELLEGQVISNESNSFFLNIIKETTPKLDQEDPIFNDTLMIDQENPIFKDTLTKITKFLDDQSRTRYPLNLDAPYKARKYLEIYKDPNQGYILRFIATDSGHTYTTPLKDLYYKDLISVWDALQMNSNE